MAPGAAHSKGSPTEVRNAGGGVAHMAVRNMSHYLIHFLETEKKSVIYIHKIEDILSPHKDVRVCEKARQMTKKKILQCLHHTIFELTLYPVSIFLSLDFLLSHFGMTIDVHRTTFYHFSENVIRP